MKKFLRIVSLSGWGLVLPALAFAQTVDSILVRITNIISDLIIPLLIGLAVVFFLWGVVQYIMAAGDEEKKKSGRDHMIYGIIAIFVMTAVWGLVNVVGSTFNIAGGGAPTGGLPEIP